MSKKKIVGVISGVLILNFIALMVIWASVQDNYYPDNNYQASNYQDNNYQDNGYCYDLSQKASESVLSGKDFMDSTCLEDLGWLGKDHPLREEFEQLAEHKENLGNLKDP